MWGEDEAEGETIKPEGLLRQPGRKDAVEPRADRSLRRARIPDEDFRRWTFGAYYGLAEDAVRVMVNYEYRGVKDDVRGDDKLFLWTQVRF